MTELKAKEFAIKKHKGQKYGARVYQFHLEAVVKIAKETRLSEEIIMACWLHDTIEDCEVNYTDIKINFGKNVAEIVYAVTDELGRNRKERKTKTYPKIKSNEDAICVKLCDRIANTNQSIIDKKQDLMYLYIKEHEEFKMALYTSNQKDETLKLWLVLEELITLAKSNL